MKGLRLFACVFALLVFAIGFGQNEAQSFEKRVIEAVSLFKEGKTDEATKAFEVLHKENGRSSDVQAWLGYLYLRAGKAELALPLLQGAESQRPTDIDILNNLGNAFLATNQYDKALTKYEAIAKRNPKLFEPHYNSGTIYLRQKNYAKALEAFKLAAKLQPSDPFVLNNLGVVYEGMKQDAKAAHEFVRASDLRPDNVTFARNAGLILAKLGRPDALAYLERSKPEPNDVNTVLALADAYLRANRIDEALNLYERLRESPGRGSVFWFNLGVIRAKKGDGAGAERAYRKALELNGNDLDTLNNLGLILYKRGAYAEATTLFDKLSGLNPSSLNAKINLAAAATQAGDMKKATEALKAVVRAEPSRVPSRLNLANALYAAGDVEGARYHYNQVLLIAATNAEALNGMGLCHLKAEKLPQAEAAFRSAIEADPKLVSAYNNLAIALEKGGQRPEAIKVLERAAKIAPEDEDIKKNLQRMRLGG